MSDALRCPACGNGQLPEFFEPRGLAWCPACGAFFERGGEGLRWVGRGPRGHVDTPSAEANVVLDRIAALIAEGRGVRESDVLSIAKDAGMDSLDVVELVMEIEERHGRSVDPG